MPTTTRLALLLVAVVSFACARSEAPAPPPEAAAAAAPKEAPPPQPDAPASETTSADATPMDSSPGRIEGVVRYVGSAPLRVKQLTNDIDTAACGERISLQTVLLGRDGAVANVFIELRADDGSLPLRRLASASPTAGPVTSVAVRRCALEPHVLVVPAGSALEIRNDDGILHHLVVPALRNEPFDARLPRYRKRLVLQGGALARPEILQISCDVHPWEVGWWIVSDNPLRALTGPDGRFVLDGVPPGTWRLTAWHEDLRRTETSVAVAPGENVTAELNFR